MCTYINTSVTYSTSNFKFDPETELLTRIISESIIKFLMKCLHINESEFPRQTLFGRQLSNTGIKLEIIIREA